MKKLWVKKRFQKTGHSRRAFSRLTHGVWTLGFLLYPMPTPSLGPCPYMSHPSPEDSS